MTWRKDHARSHTQESLIAIGFTSGLASVACSVLAVGDRPEMIFKEVMPGPRKKRAVPASRRYHAHKLMFDMIFDRWPPAVIALGPPSTPDEPLEWVVFMRTAMFELGKSLRVPVVLFDTDEEVARGLGMAQGRSGGGGLKALIRRQLPTFSSNKRRVILSTATAMAGATRIRSSMTEEDIFT